MDIPPHVVSLGGEERRATSAHLSCDVVIVGCGVSGLFAALNLPRSYSIIMICKEDVATCDSMLAQGGICIMRDHDDYAPWFDDTLRAGHFENRWESVDTMIWSSRDVVHELMRLGVEFDRGEDGDLDYTREGAHSRPRIVHHADITGEEITTTLFARVQAHANITIREYTTLLDLRESQEGCCGITARGADGTELVIEATDTILCTGGIGGLFERSTNYSCLTGDGCRIAQQHGIELEHMDYVQIHPTTLFTRKRGRAFLISESCRGEGALLLDGAGQRFVDELLPRDVVCEAIFAKMREEGSEFVRLSFAQVPQDKLIGHFGHIRQRCLEEGYDIMREPIPVVPAQHYLMGGIHVNQDSQTTMAHLYAAGETSCNGVHGKNRLASNSLLESLVFARLAARDIVRKRYRTYGCRNT